MKTFDMRERRTAAETDARRSRKAQIDRVRRRLDVIDPGLEPGAGQLKNVLKAILDIMADDGDDE
jgi:hypothetical protein